MFGGYDQARVNRITAKLGQQRAPRPRSRFAGVKASGTYREGYPAAGRQVGARAQANAGRLLTGNETRGRIPGR